MHLGCGIHLQTSHRHRAQLRPTPALLAVARIRHQAPQELACASPRRRESDRASGSYPNSQLTAGRAEWVVEADAEVEEEEEEEAGVRAEVGAGAEIGVRALGGEQAKGT